MDDPELLTPKQQSNSVRFLYTQRSDFVIGFGRAGNGNKQQFAGYTNIGVDVCSPSLSPSKGPTPAPTADQQYACIPSFINDPAYDYSLITKGKATTAAHSVYTKMFVGGQLKNPGTISIPVDGHAYYGSLGSGGPWNFNAGSTVLSTLSPANYPIDFGYYEWLALNIKEGTYANDRKVFVVDTPKANGACYHMFDFLDQDAQGYDEGKTLIVFTYDPADYFQQQDKQHICLTKTHDRKWGPSVLAPFAKVRLLNDAGFSDGTIIAKEFSTINHNNWSDVGTGLQLHGDMYDGPIECV